MVPMPVLFTEMADVASKLEVPFIARAASGVVYAHYAENAPEIELAGDFAIMTRVKEMFDPGHLMNRGRLYGRI